MMAVVVAHPDDECLWLSSAVASADRIVFCFGDPFEKPRMSAARRQAVAALPLTCLVDLKLPESGARFSANWAEPQPTLAGIMITDEAARVRYEANYPKLVAALRTALAGCGDDGTKMCGRWLSSGPSSLLGRRRNLCASP